MKFIALYITIARVKYIYFGGSDNGSVPFGRLAMALNSLRSSDRDAYFLSYILLGTIIHVGTQ